MNGPCLCGDTHCPSCGPAQGNFKCPICGTWADDCCIHIDEETGRMKNEYIEEANKIAVAEAAADEAYYRQLQEEGKLTP